MPPGLGGRGAGRCVALLALSMPAMRAPARNAGAAPEMRTEIVTPSTTDPMSFALSPDGRQIVFVASGDGPSRLWLRRLDATEAQPLAGTEGASYPFWSPDSRSVGFFADSKLKRLDIGGGSPQTLADAHARSRRDMERGRRHPVCADVAQPAVPRSGFGRRAGGGDAARPADEPPVSPVPARWPAIPVLRARDAGHGRDLSGFAGRVGARRVWGRPTRLASMRPSGWVLFVRGGTLLAQRLDLEREALTGDPVTVADPVAFDADTVAGAFSVSAAGLVAYRSGGAGRRQLAGSTARERRSARWARRTRMRLTRLASRPMAAAWPCHRTVQGNTDIWLLDADAHDALHVRCESRPVSRLVAGRQPDRVRLESARVAATST